MEATCLVAADVVKVIALNFVFARRSDSFPVILQLFVQFHDDMIQLFIVRHISFLKISKSVLLFFLICFSNMLFCCQVFFCFGTSVASTRFMLQDEFNLQTTKCDNCIIVISILLHRPSHFSLLGTCSFFNLIV